MLTYILIGLFFLSLGVTASMLISKMLKVDKNASVAYYNDDMYSVFSTHAKKIAKRTLVEVFKTVVLVSVFSIIKTKPFAKRAKNVFMRYYKNFFDAVNGKNKIIKKGASSFFIKTIAQYKKEVIDSKRKDR